MSFPITFEWDGEVMVPLKKFVQRCNEEYVVGYKYNLEEINERSERSHNQQFGWLTDAWRTLPEHLMDAYPTPLALRKKCLIEAGFYDETIIDAGTEDAAIRCAAVIRDIDTFALVIVRDCFVIRRTAKSQSRRAMKKDEFQASKSALMQVVADILDITVEQLQKNAGMAA